MTSRSKYAKQQELAAHGVQHLFHLTHIQNLPSILRHGLRPLSHLRHHQIRFMDVSEPTVQNRRENLQIRLDSGRAFPIHDMVPLFFTPLTPMLYRRRELTPELCFVVVDAAAICEDAIECLLCDGNAASKETSFYHFLPGRKVLEALPWDVLRAPSWNDLPDGRRKRSAEVLVWPAVPTVRFVGIGVKAEATRCVVSSVLRACGSQTQCYVRRQYFF